MIRNTDRYRVVADRKTRRLSIQAAGTWAVISELEIPEDSGVIEALRDGLAEIGAPAAKAETAPETPAKTRGKRTTK